MRPFFPPTPVRLAALAFLFFVSISLLSRVLLLVAARHSVAWVFSLTGSFACGLFFAAVAGLFAALPKLLGALMPARLVLAKFTLVPLAPEAGTDILRDTTAFYESASWLFGRGKF